MIYKTNELRTEAQKLYLAETSVDSGVPFTECWHRCELELLDSGVPFTECWHRYEVELLDSGVPFTEC